MELIEIVALVLALAACTLAAIVLRRKFLLRGGGAVDMSLRLRTGTVGRGWALGVGRYAGDELQWFRVFTFSPRPARVLSRSALQVSRQRIPAGAESWAVQSGAVIIECHTGPDPVQLAMSEEAVTGFLSWLESSPPGFTLPGFALR